LSTDVFDTRGSAAPRSVWSGKFTGAKRIWGHNIRSCVAPDLSALKTTSSKNATLPPHLRKISTPKTPNKASKTGLVKRAEISAGTNTSPPPNVCAHKVQKARTVRWAPGVPERRQHRCQFDCRKQLVRSGDWCTTITHAIYQISNH